MVHVGGHDMVRRVGVHVRENLVYVALFLGGSRWNTTSFPSSIRRCFCALRATSLHPLNVAKASSRPRNFANQPRNEARA